MANTHKTQPHRNSLLHFKNRLRGVKNPRHLLYEVRDEVAPALYNDVIAWVRSNALYRAGLFNHDFPLSVGQINRTTLLHHTSIQNEFRWCGAYLSSYGEKLSEFLQLSLDFQRGILRDDYPACRTALDKVEEHFGQSLWLIKNKIVFLQTSEGLEAQKRYVKQVREEAHADSFIADFVAYVVSTRNEFAVHPLRITAQLNERIASIGLPEDLAAYFRYQINSNKEMTTEEMSGILRCENASSAIDYYETLLTVSQVAITTQDVHVTNAVAGALKPLRDKVRDPRLDMLLFELHGRDFPPQPSEAAIFEASDALLEGRYAQAAQAASTALATFPEAPDLREIAARSYALLPGRPQPREHSFGERLLSRMAAVVAKTGTISEDTDELYKVALNFHYYPWARALLGFVCQEISADPLDAGGGVVHFAAVGQPALSPLRVAAFPSLSVRRSYSSLISSRFSHGASVAYALAVAETPIGSRPLESLVQGQRLLLSAEGALRASDFSEALEAATKLSELPEPYYRQKSIRLVAHCLLKLDRLGECIDFVTSSYLQERHLYLVLPVKEVLDRIDSSADRCLRGNISLPIIYDVCCRFVDDSRNAERGYAYEDFLFDQNVERPSELLPQGDKFDQDKLVYFLRHLCVEPVMDCSTVFHGSQEVRDERLKVCRMLVELDATNIETYQSEIKDILRRSTIKQQMRQIEQSKIYVDIESIRKAVDTKLRESFNRYKALLATADSIFYIEPVRDEENDRNLLKLIRLILPQNEMWEIINGMVLELRDQYVSSTEHGLNGYLSVRIRHGTLSGQLRRPLEASHLITQRDSEDGTYKQNEYWPSRLASGDVGKVVSVNSRLASFSADFDALVSQIRDSWIQVKKNVPGEGLFDFSLSDMSLTEVEDFIGEETTFEAFLDFMFAQLNRILDDALAVIRQKLDQEAKSQIYDLLNSLQADLKDLAGGLDTSDINNAISMARTELQLALDRIIDWFRRSNSASSEPFGVEDVINIGVESVRTASNRFSAEVSVASGLPALFPGRMFSSFVDIVFIVFENVVRHSRSSGSPRALVTVTYHQDQTQLRIENEIGPEVETEAAINRIRSLIATMHENKYNKSIASEGGTGFHKIWKLLRHDLGVVPELNFGFGANNRFFVEFQLPRQDLEAG